MSSRRLVLIAVAAAVGAVLAGFGASRAGSSDNEAIAAQQRAAIEGAMPSEATFRASIADAHNGKTWELGRNVNGNEDRCLELRSPAGWRSATCLPAADVFADGSIVAYSGGAENVGWVHGAVQPSISKLELVRADCSSRRLPLSRDGLFLSISAADAAAPWQVRGLDKKGSLVGTYTLQGVGTGKPSSTC
jgi:hypothetical protein